MFEFEREGHCKVAGLLGRGEAEAARGALLEHLNGRLLEAYVLKMELLAADCEDDGLLELSREVKTAAEAKEKLEEWCGDNECDVPFLQDFNVHRDECPEGRAVDAIARSPALGRAACDLLGVDAVRLYQTCTFFKGAGQGETSWHSDLSTSPFDTNGMVTCWIALTDIGSYEQSPLEFASRSHKDVALPFWYDDEGLYNPSGDPREYEPVTHLPLAVGDSTWHHGWLLHSSPPNDSQQDRVALAITYVSSSAVTLGERNLRQNPDPEDAESYRGWLEDVKPGAVASHPLTPIVYARNQPSSPDARQSA